jgi:hypothetical protein
MLSQIEIITFCRILQPDTPYRILSIDNTITTGGMFFSMGTITASCIGMMQSFVGGTATSEDDHSTASRTILSRILIHIHQQWVKWEVFEGVGK